MSVENKKPLISVVVPCYNEEEVITETTRRLILLADRLNNFQVEIIFINDGSKDNTVALLRQFSATDSRAKVISLSRNFGHQIAVSAGIDASSGDAVILIDADLQDPPEVIPEMIAKWQEGFDVVYGVRTERLGESAFKRATARSFYRVLNRLSDVPIPLDTGDFRLMSRRVVDLIRSMPERNRFVRGMVSWVGFRQVALPYTRHERFAGSTKYPLRKMLRFATDGILSFSSEPLKVATRLGLLTSVLSLAVVIYAVTLRLFTDKWFPGWTALMVSVTFFGGVQLVCVGILGEYIGRIYEHVKQRPLYIVDEKLGFHDVPEEK